MLKLRSTSAPANRHYRIQVHQRIAKAEFLPNMKRPKKEEEKSTKIEVMLLP
jgi:hypothetical protein